MNPSDERPPEDVDPSAIEEETRRLMEKALETATTPIETASESDDDRRIRSSSTARMLEETFQRIQVRMKDLLSMIEDGLKAAEPNVESQIDTATKRLATKLKASGLGVFYTKTIATVREELSKTFTSADLLRPIYDALTEAHEQVDDILTKASRGSIKSVANSTSSLQSKVIQLYATVHDRERQIEVARAELYRWRKKVNELEALLSHRDEEISRVQAELSLLKEKIANAEAEIDERNRVISELRSSLAEAQSQIEQQRAMIEKLGSAEEIVADYEDKLLQISKLEGEVAKLREEVEQRDSTIEYLKQEVVTATDYSTALELKANELNNQLAKAEGDARSLRAENETLQAQIAELTARWNTLYQVAESEPAFKAYFLVADKTRGVPLSHLSAAMGIPIRRLKEDLQKFISVGLIEIVDDTVRPRPLSEVARRLVGEEEQMIEEVKAELGDDQEVVLEAFDLKEPIFDESSDEEKS